MCNTLSIMRRSTSIAVLILGVLAVSIGIGFWMRGSGSGGDAPRQASAPTATTGPVSTLAVPPTAIALAPTAVPTPAPTPANRDIVLEVSESQLDSELTERLVGQPLGRTPLGEAKIQSVAVQLRDRQVRLDGNAAVGLIRTPFVITGTVIPDGGRPMVDVREASVGGFILPGAARAALAESLQLQVDRMLSERDVNVRTIDIADGKMRLVGSPGS